jgi:hypothetical protein
MLGKEHYPGTGEIPAQTQVPEQPGLEFKMKPKPFVSKLQYGNYLEEYKAAGKLNGKSALITGGDSGRFD